MSTAPPAAFQAARAAPQGFCSATETLNSLPEALFTRMVLDLLHSIATQSGMVPAASYTESCRLSAPELSSCVQALSFIFRLASQHALSGAQLSSLLQSESEFSESRRSIVAEIWTEQSKESSKLSVVSRTLSLGRLVRLSWRVGVGISSSSTESLAAPFVTLAFEITSSEQAKDKASCSSPEVPSSGSSGSTRTYIVECTHHEFEEVRKHFQDIFAQLDTA